MTKDDLKADIVLDIFRANNLLSRIGGKLTNQVGLTSVQQWILLGTISKQEGIALKELRDNTLVTKQNISSMVERLKQSGYITTYSDATDKRVLRVKLTKEGKDVLKDLEPLTKDSNDKSFAALDVNQMESLSAILKSLVSHLNHQE